MEPLPVPPAPSSEAGSAGDTVSSPARADRDTAVLAHLSALVAFVGIPSFLGPLAVWLLRRDRDQFAADHAREALNFNLSILVYLAALVALVIVTLGVGLLVAVPILLVAAPAWLIATVMAAVRAGAGEPFRYPLSIPFVR